VRARCRGRRGSAAEARVSVSERVWMAACESQGRAAVREAVPQHGAVVSRLLVGRRSCACVSIDPARGQGPCAVRGVPARSHARACRLHTSARLLCPPPAHLGASYYMYDCGYHPCNLCGAASDTRLSAALIVSAVCASASATVRVPVRAVSRVYTPRMSQEPRVRE